MISFADGLTTGPKWILIALNAAVIIASVALSSFRTVATNCATPPNNPSAPQPNRNPTATDSQPLTASLDRLALIRIDVPRPATAVVVRRLVNDRPRVTVNGSCSPSFERVRDAFESNFRERNEVGAAVAVWVDGELAVNLWGGSADAAGRQTLASTTPSPASSPAQKP